MTRSLRKKHLQAWSVILILLPAGIIFSWLAIPNQQPVKLLQSPVAKQLPVIDKTKDLVNYKVNIRTNKERTEWQLEWKNKTVLTVPSAVIYQLNDTSDAIANARLIGRIETSRSYIFPLPGYKTVSNGSRFILYDFIHQQIIEQINFQP
jgi:hypothetical protein